MHRGNKIHNMEILCISKNAMQIKFPSLILQFDI